jgi:hypothetical protein
MALPVIHLCQFNPKSEDLRVVGSEVDGGTSLSGISDPIQTDGGGYWQFDSSDMSFGGRQQYRREETLEWRAITAVLAGGRQVQVGLCDVAHAPINGLSRASGETRHTTNIGSSAHVLAVVNGQTGGLNATILDIAIVSERPLTHGMKFGYTGRNGWGPRAAEILYQGVQAITGGFRITIQPPIRGGIAAGDVLDFNEPQLVMRRVSAPSNATSLGIFGSGGLQLVESMKPVDA